MLAQDADVLLFWADLQEVLGHGMLVDEIQVDIECLALHHLGQWIVQ